MIEQLLADVDDAENSFRHAAGIPCNKFTGAVTTEQLRNCLMAALGDCAVLSPRDSFIMGVPLEIDLLILRPDAKPAHFICYQPRDVVAALEVKNVGSFGNATIQSVKSNLSKILRAAPSAHCYYVALTEREKFTWAVTRENIGFPAYTLSTHKLWKKPFTDRTPTGDLDRLIQDLREWVA